MKISNETIQRCALKDRKCQKEIYEILYPSLMNICMRYTKNVSEAKDILHDGFIKILDCIHKYKYNGSFEGWAKKIIVNIAIDRYRRIQKHKTVRYEDNINDRCLTTDDEINIYEKIQTSEIVKMVQKLAPSHRAAFNLYLIEGFTHREISEKLGISIGASKSNLFKARRAMLKKLKITYKK